MTSKEGLNRFPQAMLRHLYLALDSKFCLVLHQDRAISITNNMGSNPKSNRGNENSNNVDHKSYIQKMAQSSIPHKHGVNPKNEELPNEKHLG